MATSIAELKAAQAKMLEKIKKTQESTGSSYEDERIWAPTFDKEKGGSAVIRFLPSPDGESEMPFAKVIKHFFQGSNGKYYTEKSLRTLQKPDPVADLNYRLYNTKIQSNMDQASAQKQRPRFYANILVIKDPANRENEGKVFLYEYGPAIDNLVQEKMFPDEVMDPDAVSVNPFNVFDAPNLNLKLAPQPLGKSIVPNYKKTLFDQNTTELKGDILEIIGKGYSLKEFTDPESFKSFNELGKKLIEVLGEETGTGIETVLGWVNGQPATNSTTDESTPVAEKSKTVEKPAAATSTNDDSDDSDDELAALRALIADD